MRIKRLFADASVIFAIYYNVNIDIEIKLKHQFGFSIYTRKWPYQLIFRDLCNGSFLWLM